MIITFVVQPLSGTQHVFVANPNRFVPHSGAFRHTNPLLQPDFNGFIRLHALYAFFLLNKAELGL